MISTGRKRFYSLMVAGACLALSAAGFSARGAAAPPVNRFGLMPGKAALIPAAKALGVRYYRPVAISLDSPAPSSPETDAAAASGLQLVLTVRASGDGRKAAGPPQDMAAFRAALARVLERYRPHVLVVESEENNRLFYRGSTAQYLDELKAACEVAHARAIPCANGGLSGNLVIFLLADHLQRAGQSDAAVQVLQDALGYLFRTMPAPAAARELLGRPSIAQQVAIGRQLLAGYRAAGADYVNFHWYSPDTKTLRQAAAFLEQASGLPAISNEVGQQRTADPAQVSAMLAALDELGLPVAVWFSIDIRGVGGARSLFSPDGQRRANGQAFADYLRSRVRQDER